MCTDLKQIKEVAEALAEHHAAVMVGSGFSKNAEKIGVTENKFLDWNQLSDIFYEKVYGDSEYPGKNYSNSMRLAQEAEIMLGRPGVEKILKQAVPDDDYAPSELYLKLMQLPWKDVFTTNYDTLLEKAADLVTNRRYNIVACQEDLVNSSNVPRIIKLHGSFPSHRPFIITEEDYRTYPVKFAAMVNTVQQSLLENVFCMIGFSCEDPNFISWIGWIHDHLGKSSSQKIYMVSISHIPDAKQKLYFDRNIVLIDLETIWPDKNITERLESFLGILTEEVEKEEKYRKWFEWSMIDRIVHHETFACKADLLGKLRGTYPGWIFLPWDLKKLVSHAMSQLEIVIGIEKISPQEQMNVREYLEVFKTVIQQTRVENGILSKSIYEQAAGVIPMVLARFCYKCSSEVLDEMLELLLQLCLSNKQSIFQELKDLIKAVVKGYTLEEQEKRVDKILQFPIASNRLSKYWDPVCYMEKPEKPYKLKPAIYNKVMLQIRQEVESKNPQLVEDGLNRFLNLKQIICLEKTDEEYLTGLLQNREDIRSRYILYVFSDRKDKGILGSIVEETYETMKNDGSMQEVRFHGGSGYLDLIYVLEDIHFCEYNIKEWFQIMSKLVETTESWIERTTEAKERIRQCCMIAQGILISLYKDGKTPLTQEVQNAIAEYVQKIEQIRCDMVSFKIINKGLIQFRELNEEELKNNLWICDGSNVNLVRNFIYILNRYDIKVENNEDMYKCLQQVASILAYRLMNADLSDAKEFISILTTLEKNECLSEEIIDLLALKLELLLEETVLERYDGERMVFDKMHCRIEACKLAAQLYKKKYEMPIILKWKLISENTDEFIEIRKIEFEKHS